MLYGSKPEEVDPKFGASVTYEYGKNLYINMTNQEQQRWQPVCQQFVV